MKNIRYLTITLLGVACLTACTAKKLPVEELLERLIPEYSKKIIFEQIETAGDIDYYELEFSKDKIKIRGNNSNSMAVGLNTYLKDYCNVTVSWYAGHAIQMPKVLPEIKEKLSVSARCKNRFFLNYCTFGYTMPWWQWEDWERLIDWMALNGVNMPLAITGQEVVWYEVWSKLGLTDDEIRNYFTGPAHLPWHRMSNLDYWQSPLPHSWLNHQKELQKKIVERERMFNMTPILPAFTGHVPKELKRIYPKAKMSQMSSWGGFSDEYRSHFLDPLDPLFNLIQKEFLTEQTKLFGTDHIYGADPFNEVDPPNWEPEFLANISKSIYESITAVDADATWLQMTWLFYMDRHKWTNPRIKAFLEAVPQDKLLLLDYYCENTEVWKQTESYYGQPYLWCYLGNFGGNTMLAGNLKEVGERIDYVFREGGNNCIGLGSTLEAFDCNPFIYEYVFEKAWNKETDDEMWIKRLADRHVGKTDKNVREAWKLLYDSIYTHPASLGQGTLTNSRPTFYGHGNWTTNPNISYSNSVLCTAWGKMLTSETTDGILYNYDIVNIGRQVLGNYFSELRDQFTKAYYEKDQRKASLIGNKMLELLNDMDVLLSSESAFSLGKWISDSRKFGLDEKEKNYYEKNARTIISTWGDRDQSLNDYANRSWSGITKDYYLFRWKLFIEDALSLLEKGKLFEEQIFHQKVTAFEKEWTNEVKSYPSEPIGNPFEISQRLYLKYNSEIIN